MKPQEILHIDVESVDNAITLWRAGELVAIPTETVYGLAADACNGQAIARIYSAKSRPQFNPLIVHVADVATAKQYVEWNDAADQLAAKFWPGPLTLVLKRRADCPVSELVSAGGDTLAIRMPSHPVALQLLKAFGGGIAAPSANRSGRVSPTTAAHVREELGEVVPLIIDGGACEVGVESTVLDVSGASPVLLRPGSVTRAMIEEVLGKSGAARTAAPLAGEATRLSEHSELSRSGEGASELGAQSQRPPIQPSPARGGGSRGASLVLKSPGMLESHYAPSLPVRLNADAVAADEALLAFGAPLHGAATVLNLSSSGDLIEAAANLFAYLRALDLPKHRAIAVMPVPNTGVGEAINDRLKRAAVGR